MKNNYRPNYPDKGKVYTVVSIQTVSKTENNIQNYKTQSAIITRHAKWTIF